MDNFHEQLREIQKIVASLYLSGLIQDDNERDRERTQIIGLLLSGLNRSEQNSHAANDVLDDPAQLIGEGTTIP